jgi:hypothetical protein
MAATPEQIAAGHAVYTKRTLAVYDLLVLGISNHLIWRCPAQRLLAHYNRHITANHLDVGVGTGYFLDRCRFPSATPRLALMDINKEALGYASYRTARYKPETYVRNILEPVSIDAAKFDSVSINYLLHCLPGTLESKSVAFDYLKTLMNPGAICFGSTLLQGGVARSRPAKRLMEFYNRKGIFSNGSDSVHGLQRALNERFQYVSIEIVGCAALFSGRTQT